MIQFNNNDNDDITINLITDAKTENIIQEYDLLKATFTNIEISENKDISKVYPMVLYLLMTSLVLDHLKNNASSQTEKNDILQLILQAFQTITK
jgi:hypothetical protein